MQYIIYTAHTYLFNESHKLFINMTVMHSFCHFNQTWSQTGDSFIGFSKVPPNTYTTKHLWSAREIDGYPPSLSFCVAPSSTFSPVCFWPPSNSCRWLQLLKIDVSLFWLNAWFCYLNGVGLTWPVFHDRGSPRKISRILSILQNNLNASR